MTVYSFLYSDRLTEIVQKDRGKTFFMGTYIVLAIYRVVSTYVLDENHMHGKYLSYNFKSTSLADLRSFYATTKRHSSKTLIFKKSTQSYAVILSSIFRRTFVFLVPYTQSAMKWAFKKPVRYCSVPIYYQKCARSIYYGYISRIRYIYLVIYPSYPF